MKHIHHIIPRHMGGSDDPDNLVELSISEHIQAHKDLYEKYHYEEDRLAYLGLEGILSKEEIVQELCSLGGKRGGSNGGKASVLSHIKNKTGFWSEDRYIQKLGTAIGSSLGGKAGSKKMIENKIGIFGYSQEEKSEISKKGGYAAGSKNGLKLKEEHRGIFNKEKHKEWSSKGGKVQKGYKKHTHPNGEWRMALPGSDRSQELLDLGYELN